MRTLLLVCAALCGCAGKGKLPVDFIDGTGNEADQAWVCVRGEDGLACITFERFLDAARERGLLGGASAGDIQL